MLMTSFGSPLGNRRPGEVMGVGIVVDPPSGVNVPALGTLSWTLQCVSDLPFPIFHPSFGVDNWKVMILKIMARICLRET